MQHYIRECHWVTWSSASSLLNLLERNLEILRNLDHLSDTVPSTPGSILESLFSLPYKSKFSSGLKIRINHIIWASIFQFSLQSYSISWNALCLPITCIFAGVKCNQCNVILYSVLSSYNITAFFNLYDLIIAKDYFTYYTKISRFF